MIPLRDKNRSLTTPVVNYALIGVCAVVFLWQFLMGDGGDALIMQFAVVPQAVSLGLGGQAPLSRRSFRCSRRCFCTAGGCT